LYRTGYRGRRATRHSSGRWEIRWTNRRTEVVEALLSRCPRAVRICIVGSRSHIPSKNILGLHREFILQSDVSQQFNLDRTVVLSITRVESRLLFAHGIPASITKNRRRHSTQRFLVAWLRSLRSVVLPRASVSIALILPCLTSLAQGTESKNPSAIGDTSSRIPKFEVVSIRPSKDLIGLFGKEFVETGVSLHPISTQGLLQLAFGVDDDRILGTPAWTNWINTNQYDIEAKVGDTDESRWKTLPRDEQRQALIPILEDRFKLRFHHETKDVPVLVLAVAKNGPKLKAVPPGETNPNEQEGPNAPARAGKQTQENDVPKVPGMSIPELISMLSEQFPGRTFVDKTGLAGKYYINLKWAPVGSSLLPSASTDHPSNSVASPDSGPSLFSALQEQLGLKLETQKVPLDVIVIDHIEKPTED